MDILKLVQRTRRFLSRRSVLAKGVGELFGAAILLRVASSVAPRHSTRARPHLVGEH